MRGLTLGGNDGGAGAYLAAGGRIRITGDLAHAHLRWPAPLHTAPDSVTLSLPPARVLAEDDTSATLSL